MENVDIVIIGGGAAGLMAAAIASEYDCSIALLEKMPKCGSKLLLTGKGRCNITNTFRWEEFASHIHPDANFFKSAFYLFSNEKTIDFFEKKVGVETVVERGQRVFPKSGRSHEVRDKLTDYISHKENVTIYNNSEVVGVEAKTFPNGFIIKAINSQSGKNLARGKTPISHLILQSNAVIIATGGLSYPLTGSTGDGYKMALSCGHTITTTQPSLTALLPSNYNMDLIGIELKNVRLDLYVNKNLVQSEFGELTFTSGGIEGALGFKVSRKAVKALMERQKVEVVIDLKSALSEEMLAARITRECGNYKGKTKTAADIDKLLKVLLKSMLPQDLIKPFMESSPLLTIQNLPKRLKSWHFAILDYVGYERSVVTAGGVSISEISRKSMESKIVQGLYFAGEVIDLDGDTGGYNLQIAFSTAALAARSAASKTASKTSCQIAE